MWEHLVAATEQVPETTVRLYLYMNEPTEQVRLAVSTALDDGRAVAPHQRFENQGKAHPWNAAGNAKPNVRKRPRIVAQDASASPASTVTEAWSIDYKSRSVKAPTTNLVPPVESVAAKNAASFNPREFVLLAKTFHGKITPKDSKLDASVFTDKDVKEHQRLFNNSNF
jgi:hypothetical protein